MKYYIRYQRLAVVSFFLVLCCFLHGQDTTVLNLIKSEHSFPLLGSRNNGIILSGMIENIEKINDKKLNCEHANYYRLKLDKFIYYRPDPGLFNYSYNIRICEDSKSKKLTFSLDNNQNNKFSDDSLIIISNVDHFKCNISIPDLDNFTIPFGFSYSGNSLSATSLLKYELINEIADSELEAELNVGIYYPNFTTRYRTKRDTLGSNNYYLMGEPFYVSGHYYSLINFNILNSAIELVRHKNNFVPIGYKEDYYIDRKHLNKTIVDSTSLFINNLDKPCLLYFWGKWCEPCLKNIVQMNELYELNRSKINLIGVVLMNKTETKRELVQFSRSNNINYPQIFETLRTEDPATLIKEYQIMSYPYYLVIDLNGKIRYRGSDLITVTKELKEFE